MNLSPETCRAELKRLIKEKVVASCWLFTSLYWMAINNSICKYRTGIDKHFFKSHGTELWETLGVRENYLFLVWGYIKFFFNDKKFLISLYMERQFHLNRRTGRQQCRCIVPKAVCTVKNCSCGWANLSPETCRADLKRLINEKVVQFVGYLHRCTKMMQHGRTNIKAPLCRQHSS